MSKAARRKRQRREQQIRGATAALGRVVEKRTCLFCDGVAQVVGMWEVPDDVGRRLMVPAGKTKVFFYMLCPDHVHQPWGEIERTLIEKWERKLADAGPLLN